jgi:hypothetical protein
MTLKYYDLDQNPYEDLDLSDEDMDRIIEAINDDNAENISLEEINYVLNILYDRTVSELQTVEGSLLLQ